MWYFNINCELIMVCIFDLVNLIYVYILHTFYKKRLIKIFIYKMKWKKHNIRDQLSFNNIVILIIKFVKFIFT
jgi:hypothetical protein